MENRKFKLLNANVYFSVCVWNARAHKCPLSITPVQTTMQECLVCWLSAAGGGGGGGRGCAPPPEGGRGGAYPAAQVHLRDRLNHSKGTSSPSPPSPPSEAQAYH